MPYMKYFCEDLTDDIMKRAYTELGETNEIKIKSLQELKDIIKDENDLYSRTDDGFLLRFLRKHKFDVSKAFNLLKQYYIFKARYSRVLTDFTPSETKEIFDVGQSIYLEYRDQNDVGIVLVRLGEFDLNKFTLENLLAATLVGYEIILSIEATQILGYTAIIDFSKFSLSMARQFAKPSFLYQLATIIQNCIPARIKTIHAVNEPSYLQYIYTLLKPFLSKKIKERIYFHGKNLQSLHAHITPDILPEELGGKQGPITEYGKIFCSKLMSYEDHFKEVNKYGYKGETLRQIRKGGTKSIFS